MRENPRYSFGFSIHYDNKKINPLLVRAVMYMHTKYVSMVTSGCWIDITGRFHSKENAEVAKKEINERFFN